MSAVSIGAYAGGLRYSLFRSADAVDAELNDSGSARNRLLDSSSDEDDSADSESQWKDGPGANWARAEYRASLQGIHASTHPTTHDHLSSSPPRRSNLCVRALTATFILAACATLAAISSAPTSGGGSDGGDGSNAAAADRASHTAAVARPPVHTPTDPLSAPSANTYLASLKERWSYWVEGEVSEGSDRSGRDEKDSSPPRPAFWWVEPSMSRWTSAAHIQQHLYLLATQWNITQTTQALPINLPCLGTPFPPLSGLSSCPPLSALKESLRLASSVQTTSASSSSSAFASSPVPPSFPSSYYTALLYDSSMTLPWVNPSSRQGKPTLFGNVAFRHVRLVNGRLKVHLPDAATVPLTEPSNPPVAVELGDAPPPSEPSLGYYAYEPELSTMAGMAFETVGFTQALSPRQVHTMAGIRMWSNSTQWPIPSHRQRRPRTVGGGGDANHTPAADEHRQPTPSLPSPSAWSFLNGEGQCQASQRDFSGHSHGRLMYHSDPYVMLQQNTRAVRQLLHQTTRAGFGAHAATAMMGMIHRFDLPTFLPIDIEHTPLDYNNPDQCAQVVDHEYILTAVLSQIAWHAFGDYALPTFTMLHDPCFFPLDVPISLLRGVNGSYYHNSMDSELRSTCPLSPAALPHASHCRPDFDPYRDARIMASEGADATLFRDNGYQYFMSQHSMNDGRGVKQRLAPMDPLPVVTDVETSKSIPSICIKDAVVGVPWYYVMDMFTWQRVDEDRSEWEKFRMNEHLLAVESAVHQYAVKKGVEGIQQLRKPRMVEYDEWHKLKQKFVRSCAARNISLDTAHLPFKEGFIKPAIAPVGWMPPSHEEWLQANPTRLSAALLQPQVNISRFNRVIDSGSAYTAPRGRPFNDSEVERISDSIAFYNPAHVQHAAIRFKYGFVQGSEVSVNVSDFMPRPLRMLILSRRNSRSIVHESEWMAVGQSLGFDMAARDFSALVSMDAWLVHINFVRSFDVVLGVHGSGMTHLQYMLPASAVLIELFPECWQWNNPARSLYGTKLARHAQVRSIVLGTPCPLGNHTGCMKLSEALLKHGVFVNRLQYASRQEVADTAHYILSHVYNNYLAIPMQHSRETAVPMVIM